MKKALATSALLLCVICGAFYFPKRHRVIDFDQLTFVRHGQTIQYAFQVRNSAQRSVGFRVLLTARDAIGAGTRGGSGLLKLGCDGIDVSLGPKENRTVAGSFKLDRDPIGTVLLNPDFELYSSNDPRDPTP